ncbi:hypothetical protein NPIL_309121 [Nephila pilipes]|uniref:Uncharacterized protein n=1 Tax=Nephila pilipes TaxID=299642 RepID=A0A8X6TD72_NEPPI|nr:hypothetical protein NPIL_309121 [Nephila pilipes]
MRHSREEPRLFFSGYPSPSAARSPAARAFTCAASLDSLKTCFYLLIDFCDERGKKPLFTRPVFLPRCCSPAPRASGMCWATRIRRDAIWRSCPAATQTKLLKNKKKRYFCGCTESPWSDTTDSRG